MGNPNILDDVFEKFVNDAKVFKDREVLRHDYLPEKLPHREEQIRILGQAVAPVLKESRCSNIFIYGKTGTGKTAVTKFVLSHLESKAKEYGAPRQILLRELQNDWVQSTEYSLLSAKVLGYLFLSQACQLAKCLTDSAQG